MYCTICGDMNHDNEGHGTAVESAVNRLAKIQPSESGDYGKGWNDAIMTATNLVLEWHRADHVRLRAGEMTAQEMRTTRAVVGAISHEVRNLTLKRSG